MYFPPQTAIPAHAVTWRFTQARGPGGQHINKVATAVELRVAVDAMLVRSGVRERLLALAPESHAERREVIIRAGSNRSQWQNRVDAWSRLLALVEQASRTRKVRVQTKPSPGSKRRRLKLKRHQALVKEHRKRPAFE